MSNEAPDQAWAEAQDRHILLEGARLFFPQIDEAEPVGAARDVVRVRCGESWFLVRVWPLGVSAAQVSITAEALQAASTASSLFPQPQKARESWSATVEGRQVSATAWLPGRSLARYGDFRTPDGAAIDVPLPASAPATEVVLEAVEAMGVFHSATAALAKRPDSGASSLSALLKQTNRKWSEQRRVVGDRAANSPEIRRWLRCGNRVLPVAGEHLAQVSTIASTTSLIHGDLWPVNLLIEGRISEQKLCGIVGWSTLREGSPLIDLAQLAVHTGNWSGALAESVLGAYSATGRISPTERRLLPAIAALDLTPRVGQLLHLAFVDDRMIGDPSQPVLRSGLKQLLVSLENLTDALAPETEWDRRKFAENRRYRSGTRPKRTGGSGTKRDRQGGSARSRQG